MNTKVFLAYLHTLGFSQNDFHDLFSQYQNYKEVLDNIGESYLQELGYKKQKISTILERKNKIKIEKITERLKKLDVQIITKYDEGYPQNLKNIFHPPYVLYVRGKLSETAGIAFVGSRKITDYGKQSIDAIVPGVGKYFSIISGGAAGCDSQAHKAAIKSGAKTIAVFGTGIDECYPSYNRNMFEKIVETGGALVSTFSLGTPGNPYNFPIRNEIVAGLSQGVVVVEAQEKSGSLITANLALDLGKELFAFPGSIFAPQSVGCNKLIQDGAAKMITSELSILEEYNIKNENTQEKKQVQFEIEIQQKIYNELLVGKKNTDQLHEKIEGDFGELVLNISLMELGSHIKKNLDGSFVLL